MVIWGLLQIGSDLFFRFSRNAPLKRRIWPVLTVASGIIFGAFGFYLQGRQQPQILFVMVPAIILITALNIRTPRWCDACGKTLTRQPISSQTQFCPHCGAELQ